MENTIRANIEEDECMSKTSSIPLSLLAAMTPPSLLARVATRLSGVTWKHRNLQKKQQQFCNKNAQIVISRGVCRYADGLIVKHRRIWLREWRPLAVANENGEIGQKLIHWKSILNDTFCRQQTYFWLYLRRFCISCNGRSAWLKIYPFANDLHKFSPVHAHPNLFLVASRIMKNGLISITVM